ncbi:hypothetical protein BAU01nite_14010 [Brevibacterium aurantiacum]|nr:hypothetical protein BAU01nite_14010 [Brevibacterium aurantiacum]
MCTGELWHMRRNLGTAHDRVVLGEEAPLVQTAPDDGNGEKAERLRLWREWLEAVSVPPGM